MPIIDGAVRVGRRRGIMEQDQMRHIKDGGEREEKAQRRVVLPRFELTDGMALHPEGRRHRRLRQPLRFPQMPGPLAHFCKDDPLYM